MLSEVEARVRAGTRIPEKSSRIFRHDRGALHGQVVSDEFAPRYTRGATEKVFVIVRLKSGGFELRSEVPCISKVCRVLPNHCKILRALKEQSLDHRKHASHVKSVQRSKRPA